MLWVVPSMALKKSSEQIQISTTVDSSGIGVFSANPVDLQLNALDQEVFVVTAIKIDFLTAAQCNLTTPGQIHDEDRVAISTTRPSAMPSIGDNNCLGTAYRMSNYGVSSAGTPPHDLLAVNVYEQHSTDNPDAHLDRIGIISTSDFFINTETTQLTTQTYGIRLYGYRARADAATYAALVQSEVLSS